MSSITSSRSRHTRVPSVTKPEVATRADYPGMGTSLVRALALHGLSETGSHLGSTLKPGGAVLTLGVFRRSRSVACVRADASPSEVLATTMVALNQTKVNLT
jgi:hypothetical protein